MTFQQTIDALSFSIQILNFKAMHRQNREIYDQIIVYCEMKQFVQSNFKQQCKILIMIIIILFEYSKLKQSKLQRDQIKRHKLNKARVIFKIFEKTNSMKNENKEILNFQKNVSKLSKVKNKTHCIAKNVKNLNSLYTY